MAVLATRVTVVVIWALDQSSSLNGRIAATMQSMDSKA